MNEFKSPLSLYVIWHPGYEKNVDKKRAYGGTEVADFLYSAFCRQVDNPIERTFGIPVYFRSEKGENGQPRPIDLNESHRNAFVILAEGNMVNDKPFKQYVKQLVDYKRPEDAFFLFQLDRFGYAVNKELQKRLYVNVSQIEHPDDRDTELSERADSIYGFLLHDLSRMLFDMQPSLEEDSALPPAHQKPPVRIFLSHAKHDGEAQAIALKNHIQGEKKLQTFFDLQDIMVGEKIEDEIVRQMDRNTALVVFLTDEFSNREWCRKEVIQAKRKFSPMVVVNDLNRGEKRSFPYLGNVPTVKWDHNYNQILNEVLGQVLRQRFWTLYLEQLSEYFEISEKYQCYHVGRTPELFDFVSFKPKEGNQKPQLVLYPDPPLGREERQFLAEAQPTFRLITPIALPKL